MMKMPWIKSVTAALLMAAAGLLAPTATRAAVFVGAFDPSFGGALADLGFRGQATFFIPDACLATTGFVNNSDPCSSGAMQMTQAQVDLYRFSSNPLDPTPTLASVTFAPPSVGLIDILLGPGQTLLGVNTPLVGPQDVSVSDSGGTIYSGPLWLQFVEPHGGDIILFSDGTSVVDPAYIYACLTVECSTPDLQSNPAIVTFTRVPEPASLALVVTALAAAAWVRRRRISRQTSRH